ncbi:MAG: hypothetical protein RLZZ436_4615 [Planctomycetota bacterium]
MQREPLFRLAQRGDPIVFFHLRQLSLEKLCPCFQSRTGGWRLLLCPEDGMSFGGGGEIVGAASFLRGYAFRVCAGLTKLSDSQSFLTQ